MNSPRTLALAVVAAHLVGSMVAWPGLPEQVPLREPALGDWTVITPWSWFALPLFSFLLVITIWALAAWLGRYPLFMGLGTRRRFRQLSPDARARVLHGVREGIELAGLPVALVFLLVQIGMHEAVSGRTSLPWTLGGLVLSLLAFSALPAFLRSRAERAVEEEYRTGVG